MAIEMKALLETQNPWWLRPEERVARRYPYRRPLQGTILRQILRLEDRRAVVLMGPRQVGKSVMLAQTADDLLDEGWPPQNLVYFDFSDSRLIEELAVHQLEELVPDAMAPDYPRVLLLDEVSRAPRWDLWLKQAVDRHGGRIVVTDSAATVVRQAGRESGVGRWDEYWLETLSYAEFLSLRGAIDQTASPGAPRGVTPALLERYLELGGFPEHALATNVPAARSRLREQIVAQAILRDLGGRVKDPDHVRKLFAFLVRESGGIWNETDRASDLQSNRHSVRQWRQLLEDTLLVVPLERFTERPAVALRSRPKIYAADHGLVAAFALTDPADPETRGRIVETTVFRHLRELLRGDARTSLSYYRDRSEHEVDFVLDLPGSRVLVEVTISGRLKPGKLSRLEEVARKTGAERKIVVFGGAIGGEQDRAQAIPLGTFLLDPQAVLP
jgi:predicted AAA+ superfamily ATPase